MAKTAEDDAALVAALKDGDESAFAALLDLHTPAMLRVARGYVPSREIAEEVVQETWIALLKGIGSFEGRSSLRTWLFTVLINIAKRRGMRERRDVDMAVMAYTGARSSPPDSVTPPIHTRDTGSPTRSRRRFRTHPRVRCWAMN